MNREAESCASSDVRLAVVVSAIGGKPKVTDMLLELVSLAKGAGDGNGGGGGACAYESQLATLREKHVTLIRSILPAVEWGALLEYLDARMNELRVILRAVVLTRRCDSETTQMISGYGELW